MNAKEALVEIKKLLFTENVDTQAKFALTEGKLVDGTVVSYDLETAEIYVVGADGVSVPAPVGEHQLESGEIVVVIEEGKIAEVKKAEEAPKVEVEVEAADDTKEDVPAEEPKKDEAMAKFEEAVASLSAKVDDLAAQVDELKKKNESMKEAVKLSAEIIESLAKEPSDKAITQPNNFQKVLKSEKDDRFNNLQKAFQNLKNK
jgi:outer membrane murein-binding lipoprotein Lpp